MGRREQEDDSVKLITWVQSLIHVITLLTSGMHLWSWHSYCEMRRESRDFPDTHRPASLEFAEWYSQNTQLQIKVEGSTVQRIWGKGMLIPKVRPYHTPSPKSQGTSQKRGQKGCKDQRLGTNAMKSYLNIWLLHSQIHKSCGQLSIHDLDKIKPINVHTAMGEGLMRPHPRWEALGCSWLLGEGELISFRSVMLAGLPCSRVWSLTLA